MTNNRSTQLVSVLKEIGTIGCIEKAETLEKQSSPIRSLNLRGLGLNVSNVISIANCLHTDEDPNMSFLTSISFSYNVSLGDSGAIALIKNLPNDICEIGLVDCGIGDLGGIEILNWMKNASRLRMICMEQNDFSEELRREFRKFSGANPQMLVII